MRGALGPAGRLLAAALLLPASSTASDEAYRAETETWRQQRQARLTAEDGWLSVVGLFWIDDGAHRLGREAGNDMVLSAGPPQAGVLERRQGRTVFKPAPGLSATLNGRPLAGEAALQDDGAGPADLLAFDTLRLTVIKRGDRLGLRVKDAASPARRGFRGLQWYPVDEGYRVRARFVAGESGKTIPIANVLGQVEPMPSPGHVVFTLGGREMRLDPVIERGETQLFFIFRDGTAGRETYGAGRFLYADPPRDGAVVLDFNRAYSPPCAFTDFATCPLPPARNRLPVRIEAGEKRPEGH